MPTRQDAMRAALDHLHAGRGQDAAALLHPHAADHPDAAALLGLAIGLAGDVAAAAPLLARAAAHRPGAPHPVRDLSGLLRRLGRAREAPQHLMLALELRPDDPWAAVAVSEFLLADGHPAAAAEQAKDAVGQAPGFPPALNAHGTALMALGLPEDATASFRAATRAAPDDAAGWSNLGKALAAQGQFPEAMAALDKAVRLAPDDAQIGLNRAVALLKAGHLAEGWAALECRHALPGHTSLPGPRLRPDSAVAGRTVLLQHEEGFGDTIQFLRYAPGLAARGARVVAWVPRELRRLAASVQGVADAVTERPDRWDLHCPMLSLPGACGAGPAGAYLQPDDAAAGRWRADLAALPGQRIGLAWAGGTRPWDPAASQVDRQRSVALSVLAPLAALPDLALVSLQAGPHANDPAPPGMALHRVLRPEHDFADTAALVAGLDAVVSVDTAVAHLAGALGKPVLLLDRWDGCWRWGHGREDSPWYPTLRILRQARPGDWSGPVQDAVAALASGFPRPS